jgi:hypothetical protein
MFHLQSSSCSKAPVTTRSFSLISTSLRYSLGLFVCWFLIPNYKTTFYPSISGAEVHEVSVRWSCIPFPNRWTRDFLMRITHSNQEYTKLWESFSQHIQPLTSTSQVSIPSWPFLCSLASVGHSLGAALATLCLADISLTFTLPSSVDLHLITFGCPRVGNLQYPLPYESLKIS